MLKRALICIVMLVVIFGCANQKDSAEDTTEATETTEQVDANVAIEEISLQVTGMT